MGDIKRFDIEQYGKIIKNVGINQYKIFENQEIAEASIFKKLKAIDTSTCVIAGTSTINTTLVLPSPKISITVPANSQLFVIRLLRYDTTHDVPHYNATDQLVVLDKSGDAYSFARKDVPDHYIKIAESSGLWSIVNAYNLPTDKAGHIDGYSARGAKLYIDGVFKSEDDGEILHGQ